MTKPEEATVDYIADAKVDDWVWLFDAEANRYVDGKYDGRGVFRLVEVSGVTRQSIELSYNGKFDKETGWARPKNGFTTRNLVCGRVEKSDREYCDRHRHAISRAVNSVKSTDVLKQIAALVGYDDKGSAG